MKKFIFLLPALLLGLIACNSNTGSKNNVTPKTDVKNNGVHIDYTDSGQGDTTLLFVHGWCINKTYWENQVPYFNKSYRVITIDLPGYGKSGKNRADFNTISYAKDVNTVINQLKLKNVILVGHSMAGDIVLQAAVNDTTNVIGLVGIDNFKSVGVKPANEEQSKKEYADAMAAMKKNFKSVSIPYFNQQLFYKTTSAAVRKRILNDVTHADTIVALKNMEAPNLDEVAKLKTLNKKLYLLNSDYEPIDVSGLKQQKLPYDLTLIHATGHYPMVEKSQEFNVLLAGVIKKM